jgi:hypothetical protein
MHPYPSVFVSSRERCVLHASRVTIDRARAVTNKSHRGPCGGRRQPGEHWMNGPDARQVSSRPCPRPRPSALPAKGEKGKGSRTNWRGCACCTRTGCRRQVLVESPCNISMICIFFPRKLTRPRYKGPRPRCRRLVDRGCQRIIMLRKFRRERPEINTPEMNGA